MPASIKVDNVVVDESDGAVAVVFERSGGIYTNLAVSYRTENGTAGSDDYSSDVGGFAFFTFGVNELTLPIGITDDYVSEGVEDFYLLYQSGTSTDRATITIIDNDGSNAPPADLIDFDDVYDSNVSVGGLPSNYQGFTWGAEFDNDPWGIVKYSSSGYENLNLFTDASGEGHVAYTNLSAVTSISRSELFDFESAALNSAWNDGLIARVSGYRDNVVLGFEDIVLDTDNPMVYEFDDAIFDSVDKVEFSLVNYGTDAGLGGGGDYIAIDDILIL
ncbi:Calx-beta domain-containing protein [Neptuniibacter sp.]|uniref:Calx-beta domain-containing protein n=1 Tax=Neptuniibacter sp. TaxID=1962643 RepID=UPI00263335E7|nr:Calx-beta domain-containing protein [Neptuniibacter sp.]MCP4595008.1 hypothetical protein [Neptuniibacter sp.]